MEDTVTVPADSDTDRGAELVAAPRTAGEFQDFVEPHWPTMARFARRIVPGDAWEDVLQDALTTAWRKRRQFDGARGSARSWLLAVVADRAYKTRRRRRPDDLPLFEVGYTSDQSARLDVRRAVARLAPRQQLAVVLRYYLELSTDEAAQVMRCSTGTVKSTLSDARRHLEHLLEEDYRHA